MSGSINSILNNASTGLLASQTGISVLSDNIANAGVAGFTSKQLDQSAFEVGGQSNGVRTGLVTRSVNAAMQASVWSSASTVGALTVQSQVLSAINATQGTPGDGTSLADAVTALQSSFTVLQSQPSDDAQQSAVAAAAGTLAQTINSTANTITTQRNSVQSNIVSAVTSVNSALQTVQTTTQQIIAATSAGQPTADLEDQRDTALQTLSGMLNLSYDEQSNGDITILGQNGLSIPLSSRLSTESAVLSPGSSTAAGSVPPVLLQSSNPDTPSVNVTSELVGGQLGELIQLRDTTLPAYTATLDTFSATLANQFSSQGVQLFTDGTGSGTLSSYAGLSSQIQVNPAVVATPSFIRDGTNTGTSLNRTGAAGFTGLIDNVLNNSFAASGSAPSLGTQAQNFISQQSADTSQASTNLSNATSYQTTVTSAFSSASGVNVDNQMGLMIQLQNSYQANARVIQASESMFQTLMTATTTTGV